MLGLPYRVNARVRGRSGLNHSPAAIIHVPGLESKYAIFMVDNVDFSALIETLMFYRDTGIQPVILCRCETPGFMEEARDLGIIVLQYKDKVQLVYQLRRLLGVQR